MKGQTTQKPRCIEHYFLALLGSKIFKRILTAITMAFRMVDFTRTRKWLEGTKDAVGNDMKTIRSSARFSPSKEMFSSISNY